uniref:Uncharacterized protein n=1 Tax=Tetranychus urticae TaxID=32264 RepID=T1KHX8_TETUR
MLMVHHLMIVTLESVNDHLVAIQEFARDAYRVLSSARDGKLGERGETFTDKQSSYEFIMIAAT